MTRIIISIAAAAIIAISNAANLYSQDYINTPVTISKEKVKIDGKVYYSHIVLEKQTLFSISKAYEVSSDEIYKCNPSLKETGLKKNSIILIPIHSANDKKEIKPESQPVQNETVSISTNDEKNIAETVPSAERDYKKEESKSDEVKVKGIAQEISSGDIKSEEKRSEKGKKKNKTHTVRWFEDLDTIAEKYGVSVEDLMKANNLTGRKLSNRQKLIIPTAEEIQQKTTSGPEEKSSGENITEQTENIINQTVEDDSQYESPFSKNLFRKNRTDISLVLPLKADGISGSRHNMDFYAGALIAVKELGEQGININLSVYDNSDQNSRLTKEQLAANDVIIGPVTSGNISNFLNIAAGSCYLVSPLDPKAEKLAETNWNLIQAPTPHKVLYEEMMNWIVEEKAMSDSVIFITEKSGRDPGTYAMLRAAADSVSLQYRTFSYSILEGRDILGPLTALMSSTGMNRFIVASESEAFVNDVVRNLNLLIHNKYNVTLYAPAKIRSFETIEVENLHNANLHLCIGYDIDYDDSKVRAFLTKYRALYNAEPSQFAFQGYDLTRYYISICSKYGKRWPEALQMNDMEMLQSSFRFRPLKNGGWINKGVRKVVYGKDWSIQRF